VSKVEAESTATLASTCEEAEGLVQRIALLEGELAEARQAREMAKENSQGSSDAAVDVERWWEEFDRESREQFEELTLLQSRGSELCLAIVGLPRVRNHLSKGMRIAAFRHTDIAKELTLLQAAVSSTVEFALGCSPSETFWMEVVDELATEFQKQEEQCSRLERPGARVYDLILGPPSSRD
jgi:hypothetical protein